MSTTTPDSKQDLLRRMREAKNRARMRGARRTFNPGRRGTSTRAIERRHEQAKRKNPGANFATTAGDCAGAHNTIIHYEPL